MVVKTQNQPTAALPTHKAAPAKDEKVKIGHIPRFEFDTYEMTVGDKVYPILNKGMKFAVYYDTDKNGKLSLEEMIEASKRAVNDPDDKTNVEDFLLQVRQHMIGQPSVYKDDYPSLEGIYSRMYSIAAANPDRVDVVNIGQSTEGRPILAMRLSNDVHSEESKNKPSVIVTGNIHAREWITNDVVATASEKLLAGDAEGALEDMEIWMLPNVNPDGYVYTREVDPLWRKNTMRNDQGEVTGVDLNRQFPHYYRIKGDSKGSYLDDFGANDQPNLDMYRGEGPLVEPEAKVIKNLLDQERNSLGLLDVHSFGQLLISGSGTHDVKPEEYESICNAMNGAMEGVDYKLLPDNGLYPVSGGLASYVDSLGKVGLVMETAQSFQPGPEKRDIEVDRASDAVVEFVRQMQARANGNA